MSARRLRRVAGHVVGAGAEAPREPAGQPEEGGDDARLRQLFGSHCYSEGPLVPSGGGGRRYHGIDLAPQLLPEQVEFLLDALANYRIVSIAGQDLERFTMGHFERFANHWGALLPHPNNFTRGGVGAQGQGASDGEIEWIPFEQRTVSRANQTFPGQLQCLPHESPAVLVTSNFGGPLPEASPPPSPSLQVGGGGSWHTDIEYEPEPIYVSMFLVQKAPVRKPTRAVFYTMKTRHYPSQARDSGQAEGKLKSKGVFNRCRAPRRAGRGSLTQAPAVAIMTAHLQSWCGKRVSYEPFSC